MLYTCLQSDVILPSGVRLVPIGVTGKGRIHHLDIEFFNRLRRIQAGRLYYPWMESLGVSRGSAQKMKGGGLPSLETLSLICRVENACYRYLAEGVGPPFRVTRLESDAALSRHLRDLAEEPGWHMTLIEHAHALRAVVMTMPCAVEAGGRRIDYTCLEIVTGPVGEQTMQTINGLILAKAVRGARRLALDEATIEAMLSGTMGSYALLRAEHAPLGLGAERVAEEAAPYEVTRAPGVEDPAALTLARAIRALDAEARAPIEALVSILASRG